ncbi:hypothetical protein [Rhizobium leguminosarum]|uniref:hypothetical protein n=1 Tax=Rhizobium leguminosarum TaxID=384 RepID=UPI001FD979BF|nr:hypothetical protein [Rhizobium leguminosarum]
MHWRSSQKPNLASKSLLSIRLVAARLMKPPRWQSDPDFRSGACKLAPAVPAGNFLATTDKASTLGGRKFNIIFRTSRCFRRLFCAVMKEKQTVIHHLISWVKIVSTVAIITTTAAVGASIGWQNHGFVGALALGFVGLVAGSFLSSPSVLLEVLGALI